MNIRSQSSPNENNLIRSMIKDKKLFLNGEDPFVRDNWVKGKDLVFILQDNVDEFLMPYKNLLMNAGAREINKKIGDRDMLLNKLISNHDVTFIVGKEKARIGANRCVLSGTSKKNILCSERFFSTINTYLISFFNSC